MNLKICIIRKPLEKKKKISLLVQAFQMDFQIRDIFFLKKCYTYFITFHCTCSYLRHSHIQNNPKWDSAAMMPGKGHGL